MTWLSAASDCQFRCHRVAAPLVPASSWLDPGLPVTPILAGPLWRIRPGGLLLLSTRSAVCPARLWAPETFAALLALRPAG